MAVRGMLVVMCDEFTLKAQPLDVVVVRRRAVNEWLLKQPVSLTPREITEIAGKAHLPATWVRQA